MNWVGHYELKGLRASHPAETLEVVAAGLGVLPSAKPRGHDNRHRVKRAYKRILARLVFAFLRIPVPEPPI